MGCDEERDAEDRDERKLHPVEEKASGGGGFDLLGALRVIGVGCGEGRWLAGERILHILH